MKEIILTVDSGMNPSNTENMLPDVIEIDDKTYYDTVRINNDMDIITGDETLNINLTGKKVRTASPTRDDYMSTFLKHLEDNKDVIHISMSSEMSGSSYNLPRLIIDEIEDEYDFNNNVYLVDSLTGGSGGNVLTKYTEDLIEKGYTSKEIVNILENIKSDVIGSYYISSGSGFKKSGRSPVDFKLFDLLSIRYRIETNKNGKLYPLKLYKGKVEKTMLQYIKEVVNDSNIEDYDERFLSLLYMEMKDGNLDEIKDYLNSFDYFDPNGFTTDKFYASISSYGVKDQIGVGLIKKKK